MVVLLIFATVFSGFGEMDDSDAVAEIMSSVDYLSHTVHYYTADMRECPAELAEYMRWAYYIVDWGYAVFIFRHGDGWKLDYSYEYEYSLERKVRLFLMARRKK